MSARSADLIQAIGWLRDARNDPRRFHDLGTARLAEAQSTRERAVLYAVLARASLEATDASQALAEALIAVELDTTSALEELPGEVRATVHCVLIRCLVLADQLDDAEDRLKILQSSMAADQAWQFDLEWANLLYKRGDIAASRRAIDRALLTVPADQPQDLARAYNGRGILKLYLSGEGSGVDDFVIAERLYRELGRSLDVADVMYNRAMALGRQGDLPGALQAFDEARSVLDDHGESIDQLLVARAQVMLVAGLVEDIVDELPDVLVRLEAAGMVTDAAEGRLYLASAQLSLANPEAAANAQLTADQFRRGHRPGWAAIADDIRVASLVAAGDEHIPSVDEAWFVAEQLDTAGMRSFARPSWLRVAALARNSGDNDMAVRALERVARRRSTLPERADAYLAEAWTCLLSDDQDGAVRRAEQGLRLIERNRSLFGATDLRAHASDWGQGLAELLIEVAWRSGSASSLLMAAERWRAGTLLDGPSRVIHADVAPLVADYRAAVAATAEAELLIGEGIATRLADAGAGVHLRRAERALVDAMRSARVRRSDRHRPTFTIEAFQRCLDTRTFVELVVSHDRLRAVVIRATDIECVELGSARNLTEMATSLQQTLSRLAASPEGPAARLVRTSARATLAALDEQLIRPILTKVASDSELIVSPVPGLGTVPWPLLAARPTAIAPSARWWLESVSSGRASANPWERSGSIGSAVCACVGPGLVGAVDEVRSVLTHYPGASHLDGNASTIEALIDALNSSDLLHLACHATFRSRRPLFSALHLHDGPLAAFELERVERPPGAVVLAACASGVVRHFASGDGLGLATALLSAGSSVVISSTLPLPDAASAGFFSNFHRWLASGESAGVALCRAIHDADIDDGAQLAVVAAMICHGRGDWRLNEVRTPA